MFVNLIFFNTLFVMKNIFIIINIILLVSCFSQQQQYVQEIKNLQSEIIQLPVKGLVIQQQKIECFHVDKPNILKLVVYADSLECTVCAINHINSWKPLINYAKRFDDRLRFCFIFSPQKKDLFDTKLLIVRQMFDYPILLDTLREFEKLNPHLPKNRAFHTFLLDENNNVILVGNPLHNKKIEEMFYKIVEEKLGTSQQSPAKED